MFNFLKLRTELVHRIDEIEETISSKKVKILPADVKSKPLSHDTAPKEESIVDEFDAVFDDWSEEKESSSEENSSSSDEDLIVGIASQPGASELINTESESQSQSQSQSVKETLRKPNSIKIGWEKIDIWMPNVEDQRCQKKKKPKEIPVTPQRSLPDCARHLLEQLNEENVHSVAKALLAYPQQVSADAVCRYFGQISQHSKISNEFSDSMRLSLSLFRSLIFVVPSQQGMVLYKSIFLSLQHQIFSLLKTGDGPQHILIRKSLLGIASIPDKSQSEFEVSPLEEINALLDEDLGDFSDTSDAESNTASVIECYGSEEESGDKLAHREQDSLSIQNIFLPSTDPGNQAHSSSARDNEKMAYFLTNLILSATFELVKNFPLIFYMVLRVALHQIDFS